MGLSASQGRMLSLTSRLSDLEFKSQNISNQKVRMAQTSQEASKNYLDALDSKKITVYNADINAHVDATLESLYKLNNSASNGTKRVIVDTSGNVVCPEKLRSYMPTGYSNNPSGGITYAATPTTVTTPPPSSTTLLSEGEISAAYTSAQTAKANNESAFGSLNNYLEFMFSGNVPTDSASQSLVQYYTNIYNGMESYAQSFGYTTANPSIMASDNYQGDVNPANGVRADFAYNPAIINTLTTAYSSGGALSPSAITVPVPATTVSVNTDNYSSTEWLYTQLSMGNLFIVERKIDDSGTESWQRVSWSSGDGQLRTENDELDLARAEADYEASMSEIQAKDKKFDLELKTIDTEHSAIQQELDSVSKVMDKNIERTFKLFS